jgi:ubiquitin-like 1-activating enzyme E1 B
LIDLDTIEVSNLNRQFLFRQEHVGHSKAVVAAEAVKRFNPEVRILAKEGNIKDSKFDTNYFSSFTIVLNALDNIDARNHVNRMCLASNVPLIDAGTTGYMGQVMPIFKGNILIVIVIVMN